MSRVPGMSGLKWTQIPSVTGSHSRMAGASSKASFDTGTAAVRIAGQLKLFTRTICETESTYLNRNFSIELPNMSCNWFTVLSRISFTHIPYPQMATLCMNRSNIRFSNCLEVFTLNFDGFYKLICPKC